MLWTTAIRDRKRRKLFLTGRFNLLMEMEIPTIQTRTATAIKTTTKEKMITTEKNITETTTETTPETTTAMVRTTYRSLPI